MEFDYTPLENEGNQKYREQLSIVVEEIQEELKKSAYEYYSVGIRLYKDYLEDETSLYLFGRKKNEQVIIGNLCISIELMLKAIIAQEAFIFLYSGLPDEIAMALTYPDKVKAYNFASELTSFKKPKSIEFNEAITRFYKLYPERKKEFSGYLDNISDIRNNSVHTYLPKYYKHQLDRIVYTTIKVHDFCCEIKMYFDQILGKDNFEMKFMEEYKKSRVEEYEKKIGDAKNKTKSTGLDAQNNSIFSDEWNKIQETCPICKSKAILHGETVFLQEEELIEDLWDNSKIMILEYLKFNPASFECSVCGLLLEDIIELEFASLDVAIDRSELMEDWKKEKNIKDNDLLEE
ncbi:hypothetical protein [Paenibacillus sp. 22594]|uniref:hypothetical protein n=1 Tax=Paenibacillus sp. 22594 TaxID=3453947 RepID=UPI003F858364